VRIANAHRQRHSIENKAGLGIGRKGEKLKVENRSYHILPFFQLNPGPDPQNRKSKIENSFPLSPYLWPGEISDYSNHWQSIGQELNHEVKFRRPTCP